jgi:hypothetical protein
MRCGAQADAGSRALRRVASPMSSLDAGMKRRGMAVDTNYAKERHSVAMGSHCAGRTRAQGLAIGQN